MNYSDFEKWVNENDRLYKDFIVMKQTITKYLNRLIQENDDDFCNKVCSNFNTVLAQCDEISYNEEGVPEAYTILHFLDRYHRFQLIFMDMIKQGCFPIKESIALIDIGTGPGPSMYAFSNIVNLIQEYEKEKSQSATIKKVMIDYAEQSHGFRHFLHAVTEYLWVEDQKNNKDHKCYVPFHHGTYYDADEMKFSGWVEETASISSNGVITFFEKRMRRTKKSFDMVIYSNFLTNMDVLVKYKKQIRKAAFFMRNQGTMVVVGGNPEDRKYLPVYKELDEIILKQRYNTRKYVGNCKKVIDVQRMSYPGDGRFAHEIKGFYREMIDGVTHGDWGKLNQDFEKKMKKYLEESKDEKWYLTVFKRMSHLKRRGKDLQE